MNVFQMIALSNDLFKKVALKWMGVSHCGEGGVENRVRNKKNAQFYWI